MEVVRVGLDGLNREVFTFNVTISAGRQLMVFLTAYLKQYRPTKRHGWKTDMTQSYNLYDKRAYGRKLEEVPRPEDVEAEAIQQTIAGIVVLTHPQRADRFLPRNCD